MHDPYTQICTLGPLTLWHKDPEKHGDDDSCGWFLRHYHLDNQMASKILSEFQFNFKHNHWFTDDGMPKFSTMGIVLNMYGAVVWQVVKFNRSRYDKFFQKHLYSILKFAENDTDSLNNSIVNEYRYRMIEHDRSQVDSRDERIAHFANVIYADVMRKIRPWYNHPRWHITHWRVSFNIYNTPYLGSWLWRHFGAKKHNCVTNVDSNLRDTV